jgi:hypothetical protein
LLRGNQRGALKMFVRSKEWLNPLPDTCCGIDIHQFRLDAYAVELFLQTHPDEHSRDIHQALLKPVPMKDNVIL